MEEPVRRRRTIEPIGQDWAGEPARRRRPGKIIDFKQRSFNCRFRDSFASFLFHNSAHFIIGYEGEIIQCIPLEEQAYAVMFASFLLHNLHLCHRNLLPLRIFPGIFTHKVHCHIGKHQAKENDRADRAGLGRGACKAKKSIRTGQAESYGSLFLFGTLPCTIFPTLCG